MVEPPPFTQLTRLVLTTWRQWHSAPVPSYYYCPGASSQRYKFAVLYITTLPSSSSAGKKIK